MQYIVPTLMSDILLALVRVSQCFSCSASWSLGFLKKVIIDLFFHNRHFWLEIGGLTVVFPLIPIKISFWSKGVQMLPLSLLAH